PIGPGGADPPHMTWGPQAGQGARVEDGFMRSNGLGANLVPPLSLVVDHQGLYFDATRPSDLEQMIANAITLPPHARRRAQALHEQILDAGLSKYNTGSKKLPNLPRGPRILVPGQVENDASLLYGGGAIRTNVALLEYTRRHNPNAVILYKPHPDVEAGLRPGAVPNAGDWADVVLPETDPIMAIGAVAQVWTMTSLLGFEALLQGKSVTCLGLPFYAGWGLTDDRTPCPRRIAQPDITALVHAALITYPRYYDPISGLPCPPEQAIYRLSQGMPTHRRTLRYLAKLQGLFASYAYLWR
ncbi:MAG: capsular polysaccharide biosynthesis protein, partial [Pseudomonadota bacterium]